MLKLIIGIIMMVITVVSGGYDFIKLKGSDLECKSVNGTNLGKHGNIEGCYQICISQGWADPSRCKYFNLNRYFDCIEYAECDTVIYNEGWSVYQSTFDLYAIQMYCYDNAVHLGTVDSPGACGRLCKEKSKECQYFSYDGQRGSCRWCPNINGGPPNLSSTSTAINYIFTTVPDEGYCSRVAGDGYVRGSIVALPFDYNAYNNMNEWEWKYNTLINGILIVTLIFILIGCSCYSGYYCFANKHKIKYKSVPYESA